jgi:hypothetical protein
MWYYVSHLVGAEGKSPKTNAPACYSQTGANLVYESISQRQPDNYTLDYNWLCAEPIYAGAEFLSESPKVPSAYINDREVNILV